MGGTNFFSSISFTKVVMEDKDLNECITTLHGEKKDGEEAHDPIVSSPTVLSSQVEPEPGHEPPLFHTFQQPEVAPPPPEPPPGQVNQYLYSSVIQDDLLEYGEKFNVYGYMKVWSSYHFQQKGSDNFRKGITGGRIAPRGCNKG